MPVPCTSRPVHKAIGGVARVLESVLQVCSEIRVSTSQLIDSYLLSLLSQRMLSARVVAVRVSSW